MSGPLPEKPSLYSLDTSVIMEWQARHYPLDVFPLEPEIQEEAARIEQNYPELMDERGMYESADAYVIALARVRGAVVVSQETSAAEKRKPPKTYYIPDVCRDLGLHCITLLGLIRREGWTF